MISRYPHLFSGLLTLLIVSGLLAGGGAYARSLELGYVHGLDPLRLPQADVGSALQQAALEQPDLLVVYGSSELLGESSPYQASRFFQTYPTGFDVYPIAVSGAALLDTAQDLAAVGPELHGKKVVFSFTPSTFYDRGVDPQGYAADFSRLHANALIFNPSLSLETRRIAASRMEQYPDTLKDDPLLQFAIQQLACGCTQGFYLYDLSFPLGQLQTGIIRMQDHWEVLNIIRDRTGLNPQIVRKPASIDWQAALARSIEIQKSLSSNNPYGVENGEWANTYSKLVAVSPSTGGEDARFLQNLNISKEWTDFDLVLRILKEEGAQPLILSRPFDGPLINAMGLSWQARQTYYLKLQDTVSRYGFAFVDYANHDGDLYFSIDQGSHPGRPGWVFVDLVLDQFYHGRLR